MNTIDTTKVELHENLTQLKYLDHQLTKSFYERDTFYERASTLEI